MINDTSDIDRFRRHLKRFAEQEEEHLDYVRRNYEANRAEWKKPQRRAQRTKAQKRLEKLEQEFKTKAK